MANYERTNAAMDSLSSGLQEPSRLQDLADAWDTSRRELLAGRIDSLLAARERRLILRMAEEEGITVDEMVAAITAPHFQRRRVY